MISRVWLRPSPRFLLSSEWNVGVARGELGSRQRFRCAFGMTFESQTPEGGPAAPPVFPPELRWGASLPEKSSCFHARETFAPCP